MSPQAENLYNFPPDSQEVSGSGIRRSFQDPSNHFATQLLCLSDGTYRIPSQPDNSFALPEPPACSDINSDWSNNATLAPIGDQSEISQWSIPGATDSFSLACVQADDYNEMAFVNSAPHESRAGRPRKQSGSGTSQCPKERRREQVRNAQRALRQRQKEHTELLTSQLETCKVQVNSAMTRIEFLESICRDSGIEYPPWDLGGSHAVRDGDSQEWR